MAKPQYGAEHRKRRAALLPFAYGRPCPLCGRLMHPDQPLDLDHSTPHALGGQHGDRIVHASCNRAAGARLGNARRRRPPPNLPTSGSF